jgi:hypothetical protein
VITYFAVAPSSDAYFEVHVADTGEEMRAHIAETSGASTLAAANGPVVALCVSAEWDDVPSFAGIMFFSRDEMTVDIVAHEIAHAAFRFVERRRIKVKHWRARIWLNLTLGRRRTTLDAEELYARAVEVMTRQFWVAANAVGLAA